jgi:hypothetical protein
MFEILVFIKIFVTGFENLDRLPKKELPDGPNANPKCDTTE